MRIDRRAMIGRVSLQKSDRDRLAVLGVAHAGALAEDFGRADPRAGAAENILFVDAQGRAGGIAGGDLADEAGDVDAGRAGLDAGRVVAEIAAVRFDQRSLLIKIMHRGGNAGRLAGGVAPAGPAENGRTLARASVWP